MCSLTSWSLNQIANQNQCRTSFESRVTDWCREIVHVAKGGYGGAKTIYQVSCVLSCLLGLQSMESSRFVCSIYCVCWNAWLSSLYGYWEKTVKATANKMTAKASAKIIIIQVLNFALARTNINRWTPQELWSFRPKSFRPNSKSFRPNPKSFRPDQKLVRPKFFLRFRKQQTWPNAIGHRSINGLCLTLFLCGRHNTSDLRA